MFWGIMIPMIIVAVALVIIGEGRLNKWFNNKRGNLVKWFDRKFRCRHDFEVRNNYLQPETEISECKKCGRKEIIKEEE